MSKYVHTFLSCWVVCACLLGSLLLISGCDTLEDLIPNEIAFWEDGGGGDESSQEDRTINNPLLTSGILLDGTQTSETNQNSLIGLPLGDIPNTLNTLNTTVTAIVSIDPVSNRIEVINNDLTFSTSSQSPIGRGSRTRGEWGKLRNFNSLYYRNRANNSQTTSGRNYIEYHALSYIIPLIPDEESTQVLNEIVRAHMVLQNEPPPTGPFAIDAIPYLTNSNDIPPYDASSSDFNADHYGLYQYNVGYGIWHGENAQATDAEILSVSGTASYVGTFLGRQRVALNTSPSGITQEQTLIAVAREQDAPVVRFEVDFGTPSSFTFVIESTELSIINQAASGSIQINLSGQGSITAGALSGGIDTANIQTDIINFRNARFNIEEFPIQPENNSVEGYFYKNGSDFNAALAGVIFAEHSLNRGIYQINYNIDGVFLAEKE